MPVELKPKAPAPSPHGFVQSAGKQEDFFSIGNELAATLGWKGEDPALLGNDISVEDARGFLVKTAHEYFIAGAKGEPKPDHAPVCEHLALADASDLAAVESALSAVYESGKGTTVTQHAVVHGVVGANVILKTSDAEKAG